MKQRKASLFVLTLILFAFSTPAYAVIKNGTSCSKGGASVTIGVKKFSCVKSGKKLIWKQEVSSISTRQPKKPDVEIAPVAPAQVEKPPLLTGNDVEKEIQKLLFSITIPSTDSNPAIDYLVQSGPNGKYPEITKRSADFSLSFFKAAGFPLPMNSYVVVLGRDYNFIHSELVSRGCYDKDPSFNSAGWYGFCKTNKQGVVVDPILAYGPPYSTNPKSDDLGIFTPSEQAEINWQSLVPHEIFHSTQKDWSDGTGSTAFKTGKVPQWFSEGVPQLMAFMSISKMDNKQISHVVNTYIGNRGNCNTSIRSLNPGCQYTEGISAVELLIARHGGFAAIKGIQDQESSPSFDFASTFKDVAGIELTVFYDEVDNYLRAENWIK